MDEITTVGLDLAKRVVSLCGGEGTKPRAQPRTPAIAQVPVAIVANGADRPLAKSFYWVTVRI